MTTRLFLRTSLALGGVLALMPCVHARPHKAPAHKAATASHPANASQGWVSDPALLKQLGPSFDLDPFTIRPPKGYDLEQKPLEMTRSILQIYSWSGEKRADQSQPSFTILVFSPQPGYKFIVDEDAVAVIQKKIQGDLTDYVQSPVSNGTIHQMDFTRAYWKGTDKETSQHIHGFTYTHIDTRNAVVIIGQDAEPYNKETLALAEAAAETLHQSM